VLMVWDRTADVVRRRDDEVFIFMRFVCLGDLVTSGETSKEFVRLFGRFVAPTIAAEV